jgi:hypothetical protein
MTADETRFFRMLDGYAKIRFRCFLAEMTLRTNELGYDVCFRPLDASESSPNRNVCKYLFIAPNLVKDAAEAERLPVSLMERLNDDLSSLGLEV